MSVAVPGTILNTIVADTLCDFADRLENAEPEQFKEVLGNLLREKIKQHRRILFSGNGYDTAWTEEAANRGLPNLPTTADAVPCLTGPKNVALFAKHGIYTASELASRQEILLEGYCKTLLVEGKVMLEMVLRDILPAVMEYSGKLANIITAKGAVPNRDFACLAESALLDAVSCASDEAYKNAEALETVIASLEKQGNFGTAEAASAFKETLLPRMESLRHSVDTLETRTHKALWPYPSYGKLIYLH